MKAQHSTLTGRHGITLDRSMCKHTNAAATTAYSRLERYRPIEQISAVFRGERCKGRNLLSKNERLRQP